MLAQDLYGLRSNLESNAVMFAYSGFMTEQVRLAFGEILKRKLTEENTNRTTMRSVFAVFVEQMQNVIRYSVETGNRMPVDGPEELRSGILAVCKEGDDYAMLSGNMVLREDVDRLKNRLSEIQAMDRDELKAFYKQRLRDGPDELSKGAGVGFIEIARRASRPIEFDFTDVSENASFFVLKASI